MKKILPKVWWSCGLWIVATYVIAADLLPVSLLVLVNSAGYLPYSDRPGPGWQAPHFPGSAEIHFFIGFAALLFTATALCGLIFALAGLVLGFCSTPRWGLRILAVPTAFLASGLMMGAVGWMIAISSVGVYIAAACGALWGLFLFPILVPRLQYLLPLPARVAVPTVLLVGAIFLLIKPFLPDPALTNGRIEVIQQNPAGTTLAQVDLNYLGQSIAREAKGSGKYISVNRTEFTTDGRNQLRVLLIIDDDHLIAHSFVLPRSGNVIYRQSQEKWQEERENTKNSKLLLELSPSYSDEINLQLDGPCCSSISQTVAPYH